MFFHSYIYNNNKKNVYAFLIKNTFIYWARLKIAKLLATAQQLTGADLELI